MKKMLVILDGASGLGVRIFGGKTSLEIAETPNLDFFAEKGKMGYMYPIGENKVPSTDDAIVSILGNNPLLSKRGVFEAVAMNLKFARGDLAVRTNFGAIENLKTKKVIDRRAGRTLTIREAEILAKALNKGIKLPCKFEFKPTIQHRGVLVLRGGFSDNVSNTDPEYFSGGSKDFKFSVPLDDEENSKYTCNILNDFITQAFKILENHPVNFIRRKKGLLPANMIFTRGAGMEIPKLKKYKTWMSVNSYPLMVGISKVSGMRTFSFEYPKLKKIDVYDNLYYSLNKSIKFAIKTIRKQHKNFIGAYVYFKETDVPGHDNKPYEKKKMLEIIDKNFFGFLKKFVEGKDVEVVVTCDHSTPCKLKSHSANPVPVLMFGSGKDNTERFSERESRRGSLGKFYGNGLFRKTGLMK
jgi:2,3-bisphosphoglycerate-independent phosphoglycerate mutase